MLQNWLAQRRDELVARFSEEVLASYPKVTRQFLARGGDPCTNPTGHRLAAGLPVMVDAVLGEVEEADLQLALDAVCRVRSVQEYSAAEAVGFVFLLKKVIREAVAKGNGDLAASTAELLDIETRVDHLALRAFDVYTKCREELADIRVREAQRRSEFLLKRVSRPEPPRGSTGEGCSGSHGQGG